MDTEKILAKYVPAEAAPLIARWINYFKCDFKVSRGRNTKFGDYRPPYKGENHRISVNYNLNQYAFLVTTVHEFAHLLTWNEHKGKAKPHGLEWKLNFKKMMTPFFDKEVFPPDLELAINSYLQNPAASSCSDLNLFRALKKYDKDSAGISVELIPMLTRFQLKDGRTFKKIELVRKRYKCIEVSSGRMYLFSPLAEVFPTEAIG
jgi:hypothetical protein